MGLLCGRIIGIIKACIRITNYPQKASETEIDVSDFFLQLG